MRTLIGCLAAAWFLIASAPQASADIIAVSTDGTLFNDAGFFGQSFTTTTLVPETNITFNFYSNIPATTPAAFGTGFLLSEQYNGTPAALSSATPGFLGEATASGGEYSFGSAVTLLPSTKYFFYENGLIPRGSISGGPSGYSGGGDSYTTSSSLDFDGPNTLISSNFLVQGSSAASVPEPSSFVLASLGMVIGVVGYGWRRRRAV